MSGNGIGIGIGEDIEHAEDNDTHIAIVGMACRLPGASTPEEYWANLVAGVDSVRPFTAQELQEWGQDPELLNDPRYVPMHGSVDGIGEFDAEFFQFSGRDATLLNPQHQLFLECAWEALERAGYDPRATPGTVGVYAGAGRNGYASVVQSQADRFPGVDDLALNLANEPEHLSTRVSYKLGLTGPSMAVMTACSTSLVAVHEASRALLAGECDVALAGGVSLRLPRSGYWYREGGTMSPDGRCRTFSWNARGIVAGDGAGVVVLRRAQDAIDDGDHVHAVIRGSAVNNDGHQRAGFTAPGVRGQAEVIRLAHAAAEVSPASISYVEAHGTGTPVGDPIEVTALTQAFRTVPVADGSVALGSVKTNIGHTDTAAGVAGLIKTVLALEHRTIPATLHFDGPNPAVDFTDTPFTVPTETRSWESDGAPRRAGVSSFGIGGTNAHVVLEEAPRAAAPAAPTGGQLLVLSARSPQALDTMALRLAEHLSRNPELPLTEVAWTLQTGRHGFAHRRYVVCTDHAQAIEALTAAAPARPGAAPALSPEALLSELDRVAAGGLPEGELASLLDTVGRLWQDGTAIDWFRLHGETVHRRALLPSYPFERRQHLVKPAPFARADAAAPAEAPAAPATPAARIADASVEEQLALLFGKVLGDSEDIAERDFFELGGDSLSAVQLLSLVEDAFGVAPPMEAIFDAPTVPEFAAVVVDLLNTLNATAADSDTRETS
ncbi:acyl transferase domain-containing protein [Kitasatospora sp. MAA4]|uniref:type I polyketide synthase n=1 Tax=Kitasatospora sp. MAA4 TaxID=3035093 RepID=UPI002476C31D|nr:beta-ketoacyl synthase N-terminal-like domain-containing protein [Kitasatospora sp. MAA4]MDH6131464.1 acyl transferase domain-containing protein [Kitasatospora sp. MAA4]